MAGQFFNQPSMAAGEIGPELYGRVDQELYYIGLRSCLNMIVRQYGGVSNRAGSIFVSEARDNSVKQRIFPFSFNTQQTYVLEIGNKTMRIVKDGGEVLETAATFSITGITKAEQATVSTAGHTFANGDDVFLSGIVGMLSLNGRTVRVADAAAGSFKIKDFQGNYINTTNHPAYVSGGSVARVYTVATPWEPEDLFDLNYAQKNDVITFVHQKYPVFDVTRTAHDAWTVTEFSPKDGPFQDINLTETTITSSAVDGTVTLTASADIFTNDDIGSLIYIEKMSTDTTPTWEVSKTVALGNIRRAGYHYYQALSAGTSGTIKPDWTEGSATDGSSGVTWLYLHSGYGIAKITARTSAKAVTATILKRLPDHVLTTPTVNWAKAAWSKTEGYPGSVSYHKRRLWLGGTVNNPNTIWCSNVGLRFNFGTSNPLLDDESITLPLDTTEVNEVRHLISLSQLIALTSSSEHSINGANGSILATTPPSPTTQGYNGCSRLRPIIIGNTAIFVEDTKDVVRTVQYDYASDSFTGIDVTARSPHLFRDKEIMDWAYQKRPLAVVWAVMSDGGINGFTFMQEQKVYAWHRHKTDGDYESVCCIREGNQTAAYKMVARTINGTVRRYLERDQGRYFSDVKEAHFVDCGLSYDGRNSTSKTITVSGGTSWDNTDEVTLTASADTFVVTDVGNQINFWSDDLCYRFNITQVISSTQVKAVCGRDIPTAYRNVARTDWEFARRFFYGFDHLEGKSVVALADGNVQDGLSISGGILTLKSPSAVVNAGLRYVSEIETLDQAQPQGQGKARSVNIPRVFLTLQESRSVFVATTNYDSTSLTATENLADALYADNFVEYKQRDASIGYDNPIPAETGVIEIGTNSSWSNTGRICVRQVYPLPLSINCITEEAPAGYS